ncbi:hypothetical protein [Streptomyces sp. JJ36]|uniref:hypothetical protein n=1 Tax=Streptomyces sp. JJ36 TaxID=2736645 RepID=UPI001F398AE4|nr:hypothetical protein [Streptomyces sp. JJ36]MCF6525520.1 hypothetical protein [Streptomyces sp. JJ36]
MLTALAVAAVPAVAGAAPAERGASDASLAERFQAVQRGGIVRAANAVPVPCAGGPRAARCPGPRGAAADRGSRTGVSSSAVLRLPEGSRVSHARLYWGGTLRAGARKPADAGGRVLLSARDGRATEVRADSRSRHPVSGKARGYSAAADVTRLIRRGGAGRYTVAAPPAVGRSTTAVLRGWALVVAYENHREPLRHLMLWDGHAALGTPELRRMWVWYEGLRIPADASGSLGIVAYGGDRGSGGESLAVRTGDRSFTRLHDAANPARDPLNATVTDHGRPVAGRIPASAVTTGLDADVFDLAPALRDGARRLEVRFDGAEEQHLLGAFFLQTSARH